MFDTYTDRVTTCSEGAFSPPAIISPTIHFLEYKLGLEYRPGVYRSCTNRGRALNTSRVLNISWGSWFTYGSSLTGLHCLHNARH